MNTLTKRLIGIITALGALAYFGITHSKALDTYIKDRKKAEEMADKDDAQKEKQD